MRSSTARLGESNCRTASIRPPRGCGDGPRADLVEHRHHRDAVRGAAEHGIRVAPDGPGERLELRGERLDERVRPGAQPAEHGVHRTADAVAPDHRAVAVPDLDALVVQPVGRAADPRPRGAELQVELGPFGGDARPAHARDVGFRDPPGEVDQVRAEVEQGVVGDGVGAPAAAPVGDLGDHRDLGPGGCGRAQRRDRGVEAPVEGDVRRGLQGGERRGAGPVGAGGFSTSTGRPPAAARRASPRCAAAGVARTRASTSAPASSAAASGKAGQRRRRGRRRGRGAPGPARRRRRARRRGRRPRRGGSRPRRAGRRRRARSGRGRSRRAPLVDDRRRARRS